MHPGRSTVGISHPLEPANPQIASLSMHTHTPEMLLESVKAQAAAVDTATGDDEDAGEGPAFRFEDMGLTEVPAELVDALLPYKPLKLSFQNNNLTSLPESLGELDSLYYLDISDNRFAELPPVVLQLGQLEILDISSNLLQRLPPDLGRVSQLQVISLKSNKIEYAPPVLADMPNLTFVELDSNPLAMPAADSELKNDPEWLAGYIDENRAVIDEKLSVSTSSHLAHSVSRSTLDGRKRMGLVMGDEKMPISTPNSPLTISVPNSPTRLLNLQAQRAERNKQPNVQEPDIVSERILFAIRQFLKGIDGIGAPAITVIGQAVYTQATGRVSELAAAIESGTDYVPQCSKAVAAILELLKPLKEFCATICAQSDVCAVRALILDVFHAFNELNNAWNSLTALKIEHVASTDYAAADELLYNQLESATNSSQEVLSLLNETVSRSALASTDPTDSSSTNEMFLTRVRDLSNSCITGFTATRKLRAAMDKRTISGITDRRKFWDDVNSFLKSIIAILAAAKSAISDLPLLAEVRPQISTLARVAKEIPPLLEQSSYKLSMIDNNSLRQAQAVVAPPQIKIPALGPLSPLIQPPTPLTASLGQAAQVISPGIHQQTPFFQDVRLHDT